jgi:hypothetical protein
MVGVKFMKALIVVIIFIFAARIVFAQVIGDADPYTLELGFGEPNPATINSTGGYLNTNGRAVRSSVPSAPSTTAIVITTWQSLIASASAGTFATINATANNLNIYDGGIYPCVNPVLGTENNTAGLGTNSANCQIVDSLVTAGAYTQAIVVPIAIGGTLCSDWVNGALQRRITVTLNRLKSKGLTAATGFTGDTWIIAHGGEQDAGAGTSRATLATCIRNYAAAFVAAGSGAARFFVPTESMAGNVTDATVTGAQADAVASGCSTCRQGANVDGLTGGTNRQSDGTHLTQTGASNLAALDVTAITNCKNTSC